MKHYITEKQLAVLKKRNQLVIESSYENIDRGIIPLLDIMNKFPGVVTIWSRSGHTIEEQIKEKENKEDGDKISPLQSYNVIFGITEEGEGFINAFLEWINQLLYDEWLTTRPKLTMLKLNWCFGKDITNAAHINKLLYKAWKLDLTYNVSNKVTCYHFYQLRSAMEDFLASYLGE